MSPHKKDFYDLSIGFLETGPIRVLVEREFASALRHEAKARKRRLSSDEREFARQLVIPEVLDRLIDAGCFDDAGAFSFHKAPDVREQVSCVLQRHMSELAHAESGSGSLITLPLLFPASE